MTVEFLYWAIGAVDRIARVIQGAEFEVHCRSGKGISVTKTHRFANEDIEALRELKSRWNVDETTAIRRALSIAVRIIDQGRFVI